jgi:hypothetical protein
MIQMDLLTNNLSNGRDHPAGRKSQTRLKTWMTLRWIVLGRLKIKFRKWVGRMDRGLGLISFNIEKMEVLMQMYSMLLLAVMLPDLHQDTKILPKTKVWIFLKMMICPQLTKIQTVKMNLKSQLSRLQVLKRTFMNILRNKSKILSTQSQPS